MPLNLTKGATVTVLARVRDPDAGAGNARIQLGLRQELVLVQQSDILSVVSLPIAAGDRVNVTTDLIAGPATVRFVEGTYAWVVFDSAPGRGVVRDLDKLERLP